MMKAVLRNSCTLILLVTSATIARATTFVRMSIEQLAHRAQLIVRAQCTGSMVESRGGEIWTVTFFEVREAWKGEAPSVARVRLLGGRTAQITSHVAGVPAFRAGEDVVLFLEAEPGGEYSILTWQQGTFRIHPHAPVGRAQLNETVRQDAGDYQALRTGAKMVGTAGLGEASLEAFRQRVQAAVSSGPVSAHGPSR
jgi:hypothetical protein